MPKAKSRAPPPPIEIGRVRRERSPVKVQKENYVQLDDDDHGFQVTSATFANNTTLPISYARRRGDEAQHREVESLLAQEKRTKHFLDSPVLKAASNLVAEQARMSEANLIAATVSHYRVLQNLGGGGMGRRCAATSAGPYRVLRPTVAFPCVAFPKCVDCIS